MKRVLTSSSSVLAAISRLDAAAAGTATGTATAAATAPRDPIVEVHDAHRKAELQIGRAPGAARPRRAARSLALNPRLIISLAAVYVIWSSTYLAVRFAIA